MYPNPQDVLPLPLHSTVEQFTTRASALVDACRSNDRGAIRSWARRWLEELAALHGDADGRLDIDRRVAQIEAFARATLVGENHAATCALAGAQFVIARAQGFTSWAACAEHVEALADARSPIARFEAAADAIINGDAETLANLLGESPALLRQRSTREHHAALIHYVAANGVENYRQKTPKNIVAIAKSLLDAGADVESEADMYGGRATTLGLAATSVHPFLAGVQNDLIDVLLEHGAQLDRPGSAGRSRNLVNACLANGRGEAAAHVASRGAALDLAGAAGVGRLDIVTSYFDENGKRTATATEEEVNEALGWACGYGHRAVVEFFLQIGLDVNARFGRGRTALHLAAFAGDAVIVEALLRRGARVDVDDDFYHTTPLVWALHAWGNEPNGPLERYHEVVRLLVAAGSAVKPEWLESDWARADHEMLAALTRGS